MPVLLANQLTLAYATLVRVGDDILHGYVSCNVLVWIYSRVVRAYGNLVCILAYVVYTSCMNVLASMLEPIALRRE